MRGAEGKGELAGRMMELVTQTGNPCGPPLFLIALTRQPGAGDQTGRGGGVRDGSGIGPFAPV